MRLPLLLDANLCVLWATGLTNRSLIGSHKRLRAFDDDDYLALDGVISSASQVVLCPHVLTETSNLIRQISEPYRTSVSQTLGLIIDRVGEEQVDSRVGINRVEYARLGLTDAILLTLNATGSFLLTADLPLYLAATSAGYPAENFNYFKERRYSL